MILTLLNSQCPKTSGSCKKSEKKERKKEIEIPSCHLDVSKGTHRTGCS
jgi:hypothetical protein